MKSEQQRLQKHLAVFKLFQWKCLRSVKINDWNTSEDICVAIQEPLFLNKSWFYKSGNKSGKLDLRVHLSTVETH